MIYDNLENFKNYISLNKYFFIVSEFIKTHKLNDLEIGEYIVYGEKIKLIISQNTYSELAPNAEVHRKFIDIQIALDGEFEIGWSSLFMCSNRIDIYNDEKDIEFYNEKPNLIIDLKRGYFLTLFPEDAHTIFPPKTFVKKAIFKVALDEVD